MKLLPRLLFLFFFSLTFSHTWSQTTSLEKESWFPNGAVYSMVTKDSIAYLGGNFTMLRSPTQYLVQLDTLLATETRLNIPSGLINDVIPDGAGGWYVCGAFGRIGDSVRAYIARINADGSVHPWKSNPNTTVSCMMIVNGSLYYGGSFTNVSGSTRYGIASADTITGALSTFAPVLNSSLMTGIASDGSSLIVTGNFSSVNSVSRNYIARLDLVTGALTPTQTVVNGSVSTVVVDNGLLYMGGTFTQVGSTARSRFAVVKLADNLLQPMQATCSNSVQSISILGDSVLIGGTFTLVNSQARAYAALLSKSGGLSDFNPRLNNAVRKVVLTPGKIYLGGNFTSSTDTYKPKGLGVYRRNMAANTEVADFQPQVYTICVQGNRIVAGGSFATFAPAPRAYFAAINLNTGKPVDLDLNPNAVVQTLALAGDTLFIGGNFDMIDGVSRTYLASYNLTARSLISGFAPSIDNTVLKLAVSDSYVYMLGSFTTVNSSSRSRFSRLRRSDGGNDAFNPVFNSTVSAVTVSDNIVYVGGNFSQVNSVMMPFMVRINDAGTISAVMPASNGSVNSIVAKNQKLYLIGSFNQLGGLTRTGFGVLSLADSTVDPLTINFGASSNTVSPLNNGIGITGNFGTVNGVARPYALIVNDDHTFNSFTPVINSTSTGISQYGSKILVSGFFTMAAGNSRTGLAVYSTDITLPLSFLSFSASRNDKNVRLQWVTEQEINTSHFNIERSTDGRNYEILGRENSLNSDGVHHYAFTDLNAFSVTTKLYYRIRQVDIDARSSYSKTISLEAGTKKRTARLYPNPSSGKVTLEMDNSKDGMAGITVMNLAGSIVQTSQIVVSKGISLTELSFTSLVPGVYFIRIESQGKKEVIRFVKN